MGVDHYLIRVAFADQIALRVVRVASESVFEHTGLGGRGLRESLRADSKSAVCVSAMSGTAVNCIVIRAG